MRRPLDELRYHRLYCFWNIVREGSTMRAAQKLGLSQPAVSAQLGMLERSLAEKLFHRIGKRLVLNEVGQVVYRYANDIFALGREMQDAIKGRAAGRSLRLIVGVTESVPKLIVYRLLEPALRMPERPEIICYEDTSERLLAKLSSHSLDIVLTDSAGDSSSTTKIYSHLLGESAIALFARRSLAVRLRPTFPKSLDGAPVLLPPANTSLRLFIDHWLFSLGIRPRVVGEFQDTALLARFGEQGVGVFAACSAVEEDMRIHHRVEVIGRVDAIRQSFYALSAERKIVNPAVALLSDNARHELFRKPANNHTAP